MIPKEVERYVYYREPNIVLLHGDCLEVLPLLEPESVDLILTDPPWGNPISCKTDWQAEKIDFLPEAYRLLVEGGRIYSFWNAKDIPFFQQLFIKFFALKNIIICWKQNMVTSPWDKTAYQYQWEPIFYGIKGKSNIVIREKSLKSDYSSGDVWKSVKPQSNFLRDKRMHDAQKPIEIIKKIIFFSSAEIILDPFLGSGTTAVAAKNLGRECIGIEIEQKYLDIAVDRLRQEVLL